MWSHAAARLGFLLKIIDLLLLKLYVSSCLSTMETFVCLSTTLYKHSPNSSSWLYERKFEVTHSRKTRVYFVERRIFRRVRIHMPKVNKYRPRDKPFNNLTTSRNHNRNSKTFRDQWNQNGTLTSCWRTLSHIWSRFASFLRWPFKRPSNTPKAAVAIFIGHRSHFRWVRLS